MDKLINRLEASYAPISKIEQYIPKELSKKKSKELLLIKEKLFNLIYSLEN